MGSPYRCVCLAHLVWSIWLKMPSGAGVKNSDNLESVASCLEISFRTSQTCSSTLMKGFGCHFFNGEKRVKPLLQLQKRTLARERKSTKFPDENFRLQSHTMNKIFHSRNFAFKQADKTSKRRHEPAVTSRPSRGVRVSGRHFSFFDSILSCTSQVILNVI